MKSKLYIPREIDNKTKEVASSQFICPHCQLKFLPKKNYQIFCSQKCESYLEEFTKAQEDKKLNANCSTCGTQFRRGTNAGATICEICRQWRKKRAAQSRYKPREEKKRKGMPLQLLIKKQEYKRLWDDRGWSHYLKGRKWDRI